METLEALGHQIQSVHDLHSVVKTMKGLAAVNIRQYEEAVAALHDYNRTLELGMQALLRRMPNCIDLSAPQPNGRLGVIVLGSDQGMCGQFNSQVASLAVEKLRAGKEDYAESHVLAVGVRVADELANAGRSADASLSLPGSTSEITRRVEDLLLQIERWREEDGVDRVWLFHERPRGGASYTSQYVQIMPLDANWLQSLRQREWPTRMLPTFTMDWRRLLSAMIRQYLFAALYRAFAESLAAENAARLTAMQAAERNVEERLDELSDRYHRRRQNSITEELLDVSAGFEVLQDRDE